MKNENKRDIGEEFLINFTESIIENINSPTDSEQQNLPTPIQQHQEEKLETIKEDIYPIIQNITTQTKESNMTPSITSQTQIQENAPVFQTPRHETIKPIKLQPFPTQITESIQKMPMEKLIPLLNNPIILSIECPGPGKSLTINKGGFLQTIPLTLTEKEIGEVMENFSRKTRIPLLKGMFRAALGNLIVSAVISEFVGTRFHIEKMNRPFPPRPIM